MFTLVNSLVVSTCPLPRQPLAWLPPLHLLSPDRGCPLPCGTDTTFGILPSSSAIPFSRPTYCTTNSSISAKPRRILCLTPFHQNDHSTDRTVPDLLVHRHQQELPLPPPPPPTLPPHIGDLGGVRFELQSLNNLQESDPELPVQPRRLFLKRSPFFEYAMFLTPTLSPVGWLAAPWFLFKVCLLDDVSLRTPFHSLRPQERTRFPFWFTDGYIDLSSLNSIITF